MTCSSGKRCNGLPRLFEDELKRFDNVLSSIEKKWLYSVLTLLESKSFSKSFGFLKSMVSGVRNTDEGQPTDGASASSGDVGESRHSRDEQPRGGPSTDSSVEYLGIIKRTNRILSRLPDQVLLSILWTKVRPSLGALESGSLSSNSRSLSSS